MTEESDFDFGACCACGGLDQVCNVVLLSYQAPDPAYGWACFVCQVEGGASAVLCNKCIESNRPIEFVIDGLPGLKRRRPVDSFPKVHFDHDYSFHPEAWAFADSPPAGDPECICSLCRQVLEIGTKFYRFMKAGGEMRFHHDCLEKLDPVKLKEFL